MKLKRIATSAAIVLIAIGLTVIGYQMFPVALEFRLSFAAAPLFTIPKLMGLGVPLAVCIVFSVIHAKSEDAATRALIGAFVGILLFAVIFAFQLL